MNSRSLTLAALLISAGIAAGILCHSLGVAGQVVLPLHYPALLAGFLLNWRYGLFVGLLSPLLSSLLTAMPPLIPSALLMAPEIAAYGMLAGLLRPRIGLLPALVAALIGGRIVWGCGVWLLTPVLGLEITIIPALIAALVTGLPGMIGQVVLIPLLVKRIEGFYGRPGRKTPA